MRLAGLALAAALAGCAQGDAGPPALSRAQALQCDYQSSAASMPVQGLIPNAFARSELGGRCRDMLVAQNNEAVGRRLGASSGVPIPEQDRPRVLRLFGGAAQACGGVEGLGEFRTNLEARMPHPNGLEFWRDGMQRMAGASEGECAVIRATFWHARQRGLAATAAGTVAR